MNDVGGWRFTSMECEFNGKLGFIYLFIVRS